MDPLKTDVAPIVNYLSSEKIIVYEAKMIRPYMEDVFVKTTGIEMEAMKK